ncbi:MAG: hypothetical protein ACD_49C00082G0005 [uncultured bacterium (gcode 4)]|uniref:Response regulatory domain-containing protein n=1 Tax=uncultured bacterium (gcode 4) TaxID=1234023 RepID=K2AVX5_9BACT|nr:MAG: hypothetical protein ACD_49C00082G0005 [uncultured bacterium (gcode 4)]
MNKNKTVLIVEDDEFLQESWRRSTPKNIKLLQAYTCSEAQEIFDKNKDIIDIIAFDWNIKSEATTTIELIKRIKQKFGWVIIAMSNDDYLRDEQMEVGCNLNLDDKSELFNVIYNLKY